MGQNGLRTGSHVQFTRYVLDRLPDVIQCQWMTSNAGEPLLRFEKSTSNAGKRMLFLMNTVKFAACQTQIESRGQRIKCSTMMMLPSIGHGMCQDLLDEIVVAWLQARVVLRIRLHRAPRKDLAEPARRVAHTAYI